MNKEELTAAFTAVYHEQPQGFYFSPGRINLIGEHTDYNGGHVFPCAISLGIYGAASPRKDEQFHFYSANFAKLGVVTANLHDLKYVKEDSWANYAKGMIHFLQEIGAQFSHGLNIYVSGNIPDGAGLSSSAALEMLIGVIMQDQFNLPLKRLDLVKLGVKTENDFIGVNSGIMDQFAVGMGQENRAILLDTNTLDYQMVPLDLQDNVIVIMNTNKRRELADSKYNERRSECERALVQLQAGVKIKTLGELTPSQFDEYTYLIADETLLKRARHAVWENERTLRAEKLLQQGQLAEFGRLVNASHVSLEYDYEVTGKELDTLVHTAWQQQGVLGARMTGAGFGGCAIALVNKANVAEFEQRVGNKYEQVIGYAPSFYLAEISAGTSVLK
ncbi:galactokinase [Lactobacillus sp. ESL0791]|uniref:galactokinase n=1 Tax=Lactobacillus sp. ESL0791 TaxID=2983234 RepID=UPI0023F95348|nr:galactokinase [Lactobacillus sp. ESL0791]MDF7639642.1 galactokinase [Lactobacillus sp. ESL0791]